MKRILVTGATGQIGTELVPELRKRYGNQNVVAVGHRKEPSSDLIEQGPFVAIDIRDRSKLTKTVASFGIDTIYHLASLLSAVAEKQPHRAWEINVDGLINVLETARLHNCSVFFPSSIAAFGPSTPPNNAPQETIQRPSTLYGITKVTGELLCDYYYSRYGIDCRGVRFPGLISYVAPPGGGTTDYAVDIFHAALAGQRYQCFLGPETRLDMMYMKDALRAAVQLMEADAAKLRFHNSYNISAMNFTPEEIYGAILSNIPDFEMVYEVDPLRQSIADSWPNSLDDSMARSDWGWQPRFDLETMTADMLTQLADRLPAKQEV